MKKSSTNESLRLAERVKAIQRAVHEERNPLNEQTSLVDESSSPSSAVTDFIERSNEMNKYTKRLSRKTRQCRLDKLKKWYSKSDRVTDMYQTTKKQYCLEAVVTERKFDSFIKKERRKLILSSSFAKRHK